MILDTPLENVPVLSLAGHKTVHITDLNNVSASGSIIDGALLYELTFRTDTPRLTEEGAQGPGGYYTRQRQDLVIPKRRIVVQDLIQQLANKEIAVIISDRNEFVTTLIPAKFSHTYDSGARLGQSNAYVFTFIGVDTHRTIYLPTALEVLDGNEGTVPGDGTSNPSPPSGTGGTASDFYARVISTPLTTSPPLTGNTTNLNRFIETVDGGKWFIDIDGNAIDLCCGVAATNEMREVIYIEGTGVSSYGLTATVDTDYSDKNMIVDRNGVVLRRVTSPTGIYEYSYSGGQITLATDWPLEANDALRVHILGDLAGREVAMIDMTAEVVSAGPTHEYAFTATVPTDYADENMILDRNGVILRRVASPTGIYEYSYSGGNIILAADWPLESGDTIRAHVLNDLT